MKRAKKLSVWGGGVALLGATLVDTLAVIGRHVGIPFTGSIELMQALVLVSGGLGLVLATAENSHARVRLVVDRLSGSMRDLADRFGDLLGLLFFAVLLTGSLWLSFDLWHAHERSEVIGVPWRILRLFANFCLLAACAILLTRIVRKAKP